MDEATYEAFRDWLWERKMKYPQERDMIMDAYICLRRYMVEKQRETEANQPHA